MQRSRILLPAVLAILGTLAAPSHLPGAEKRVFLRDAYSDVAVHGSYGELLVDWHLKRGGAISLLHFSRSSALVDGRGVVPDAGRLQKLLEKEEHEAILRLGTPLPFSENLFTPDNYLRAALEGGLVGELTWVVPRGKSLTEENFREMTVFYGKALGSEAGASMKYEDGIITASFFGRPVRICAPADLPSLTFSPSVIHVDMNFFTALYESSRKKSLLGILSDTLFALRALHLETPSVNVSSVAYGGLAPLYHSFLLDALKEIIAKPSLLDEPIDKRWTALSMAIGMEEIGERGAALELMEKVSMDHPEFAYPYFFGATLFLRREEVDRSLGFLEDAYRRDPRFIEGYAELANLASRAGWLEKSLLYLHAAEEMEPRNHLILYLLGNSYSYRKNCDKALAYYARLADVLVEFSDLAAIEKECRQGGDGTMPPGKKAE